MELIRTFIKDLFVIKPTVYKDARGYFFESYNLNEFKKMGISNSFVQDNQSKSKKGVLRGLHFQKKHPQAKLVRVLKGTIFDVAVDLRYGSETYGKYFGLILSDENNLMLMIPKGFAHGFLVLSDEAIFSYKCDDFYFPNDEGGIIFNDPNIGIEWPFVDCPLLLSEKDKLYKKLDEMKVEFYV